MDTLRPSEWDEYQGQERVKRELAVRINSALSEERHLDHVLLCATPGAGKTSLAQIIANQMDDPFEVVTMPIGIKPLSKLVRSFAGVLLLDELHRASKMESEALLPLLEFGYLEDNGRRIEAGWLTIIGATTEPQSLIAPLVDRFPIAPTFEAYSNEDMALIVQGMGRKAGYEISDGDAEILGIAAAGTPRRARKFVLAYRDLTNHHARTPTHAEVLDLCNTHWDGLTVEHMAYLELLDALGGTKGVDVLAALMRVSKPTIHQLELLLLEKGFITWSERGRELTQEGFERVRGTDLKRKPRAAA